MCFVRRLAVSVCIVVLIFVVINAKVTYEKKIKSFEEGNVLVCYGTLIVTNSNWSISGDHLINTNSAGYININDCK